MALLTEPMAIRGSEDAKKLTTPVCGQCFFEITLGLLGLFFRRLSLPPPTLVVPYHRDPDVTEGHFGGAAFLTLRTSERGLLSVRAAGWALLFQERNQASA